MRAHGTWGRSRDRDGATKRNRRGTHISLLRGYWTYSLFSIANEAFPLRHFSASPPAIRLSLMRVLIMSDMEGVSGIVVWDQVNGGAPLYEECRRLYTEEINAAVRGAKAAGASEIVVVDCHGAGKDWTFNSLVPELLDPDCTWVNHHPWSRYTELFETGCDVALMIGMHARAGTPDGVLCHTISTTPWRNLFFN